MKGHTAGLVEAMDNNGAYETYDAFKARKRKEFDIRHTGTTLTTQQKLLRVHLQHFLLNVGADVDRKLGRNEGTYADIVKYEDVTKHILPDRVTVSRSYAAEQKRLAVAREAVKIERHRSARAIQRCVRRWQRLQKDKVIKNEEEMPSTSVLIPLVPEKAAVSLQATTEIIPAIVETIPVVPPPTINLPPYEVVIELLAARDIALDQKYVEADLTLKRKSAVITRAVSTRQFVPNFQESRHAELPLQDCTLRFSLDLDNEMKHDLASPQSVIDELDTAIVVKVSESGDGTTTNSLGMVEIPLSLLETPLAAEYALCRWFPLEKTYSGHIVRGELRVSIRYLMRQTNLDNVTMIPYVNNTNSQTTIGEVVVQQQRTRPIISRKITTDRKSTVKSMQRKRTQRKARIEKLKPPRLSLKDALSSPIGRISRAEALSPPPSPSSVASSETGESVESPTPERTVKTSKRFYQPKKQQKSNKQVESSLPMEEPIPETKENSQLPPKTFLKRKPYKVVFHKLNWTNVASKTDSNLPTSVASRSSKPSRSSSQVSNSSISTSDDGYAGTSVEFCINTKSGAFIDEATAQRLTALETVMYEQCGVTRQTASLVRFKYQTERKKFATTLQNQAQARRRNLESSSQANEHDICTSEATVTELWKRLTSDSSGQMYASMLRGFIERPAKL